MRYTVSFDNQTESPWTVSLFLTLSGLSLDSVSWKQTTAPPSGQGTPQEWDPEAYFACLGTYASSPGSLVYTTRQALAAALGTAWKVESLNDSGQLVANGEALLPNQIQIENASGYLANPGLGLDGVGAIYRRDLPSGASALFTASPEYSVALFDSILPGQLITSSVEREASTIVGPQRLDFSQGTQALVTAKTCGASIDLSIGYSS